MSPTEIQYYVQKRREGWDNSMVRNELIELGYIKEDASFYLNKIDDEFVKTVNNKSDLTAGNLTTRIIELSVGIVLLIIGLNAVALCLILGPGIFPLLIAAIGVSFGYFFTKRGGKGLVDIRKNEKKRALLKKDETLIDG